MRRHEISEEHWDRIKGFLPGLAGNPGVRAKDNRLGVKAVLWIAQTGAPCRDLPERFGRGGSVGKRFDRGAKKGVWKRVFAELPDPDREGVIRDRTVIRADQHAAGAEEKGASIRPWAVPGAASAPRSISLSTPWATQSSSS